VRRFSARPIPEDVLLDILEVARWTGSAKNTQPWELLVVEDRAVLERLSTLGQYAGHLAGARLAIVLVMRGPGMAFDEGRLAQGVMLAAWAHGVGSCIGSIYPEENEHRARDLLGVPDVRTVRTAISLGYPADIEALRLSSASADIRAAVPLGRTPIEELLSWGRYGQRERLSEAVSPQD
jgi:nitroreductase